MIGSCQLAALKLVEQGKISFDTPVADYIPQFRNPIIVDRTDTTDPQKTSFKPAETVVTLKHLLNFTSGLFYPTAPPSDYNMAKGCSSKEMHLSEDPTSEFFKIITVRIFIFYPFLAGIRVKPFLLGRASWYSPEI
jgi:Beta-lactamase